MKNNYNKIIAIVLLALVSFGSQALLYKNEYFVWTYYNVDESEGGMGDLNTPGLKALSRADTSHFWNLGEPNNSGGIEHCVTQAKGGGWNDTACDNDHRLACFNGTSWALSPSTVNIQNGINSNSRPAGCPAGYEFAAPMNLDQKLELDAAIPNGGTVWINGFDNDRGLNPPNLPNPSAKEGVWVFNRGITHLFGPDWEGGAPDNNSAKNCVSINNNAKWVVEDCSTQRPLLCAKQDFSAAQVINANTNNLNPSELHEICRTQIGEQWMFAAPRSLSENNAVVTAMNTAGVTTNTWINAQGNQVGNTWQANLDLVNWAPGEPNLSNGQCVVARASDGKWQMADCDSRAKLLCSDNESWLIRNVVHQFSNQALQACARPNGPTDTNNTYSQYQLVTPITEGDRSRAQQQLTSGSGLYWINLKYLADTDTWLRNDQYKKPEFNGSNPQRAVWYHVFEDGSNDQPYDGTIQEYYTGNSMSVDQASELSKGVNAYFADQEPNGSESNPRSSCIQLYASGGSAGLWDDTNCSNSKRVACFDGYEWKISDGATALGGDNDPNEDVSAGHAACATVEKDNGVAGNFVFAAPRSFAQSQQLLTVARESGASDVWININSKKYKRAFVFNLGADVVAPFWNTGEPNNSNNNEDCAVQRNNGLWNDLSCSSTQPVACYSPDEGANGTWKLTAGSHVYSDTNTLTTLCENEFGAQYKFYAPETLSQMNDLKSAMGATPNAFINANDIEYEGSWIMNEGVNNWAIGEQPYQDDNKSCVKANATDSNWRTENCSQQKPVACYTGSTWYFTDGKVALDDFANGQALCTAEFGNGYIFKAPRSLDVAKELQHAAKLAGVGGDYWINGNSLEVHNAWKWNQVSLNTPVWGAGQPSGNAQASCAVLNNNTQGAWEDVQCDQAQNLAYMCRNGNQWQVSTQTGSLQDFSTATAACNALGTGWEFAAPATYNENVEAKNAMAGNAQVWVNATDSMKEGVWILNAAPANTYPNWANSLQSGNCVYQSDDGKLNTLDCASSAEQAWSCTNGTTWRVTTAKGKVGNFANGHKACLSEFGSSYVFAAPLDKNDTIQLDFARLLTATENNTDISKVWLNMTTGGNAQVSTPDGRKFRRNLPFSNWNNQLAGQEPSFDQCAYKGSAPRGVDNPWLTDSCTGFSAHYACTNGSVWNVAVSRGKIENGNIQIVPTSRDYWSYERGNSMCKEQFGGSFYFSAPVTAADELALDAAIRTTNAQVKRIWLNTYGVSGISGTDNKWFANRLHLGVWQKPEFRNYNNADCALLHKDGSWTDVSCKNNPDTYAFACFNGEWSVEGNGRWQEGFAVCDNTSASMFAVPRTPDEMAALQSKMGAEPIWINLTDTAFESQWIANRLRFSWWANGEPSNIGNRDCARIRAGNSANGEWYAGKCSIEAAPFACRTATGNNVTWNITTQEGVWSEGFGACQREFPDSQFMAPEGYGVVSANADQDALFSVIRSTTKDAWLNLSDQDVEGSWRAHRAYADWGTDSLFDENNDCAYLDRSIKSNKGSWQADSCKYTAGSAQNRGFACTDGYQWKIVGETASTDMRWSAGFTACQSLGAEWRFAAPTNAFENTKLKLAMELHDTEQSQIWLNAHDRFEEGEWQVNGPETNFAPIIDPSQTAVVVAENSTGIQLTATLDDDEEQGIASAQWTLVSNVGARTGTDFSDISVTGNNLSTGSQGSGTVTAQYNTPVLLKEDRLLTFKVSATDIPPGSASPATSETFVQVRVMGPLVAAWDFDNLSRTNRDITGHGHDALNDSTNPMPQAVVNNGNGVLKLDADSTMVVPGKAADPDNGLEYPAEEYTLAFRMSMEQPADGSSGYRGLLHKGDTGSERQPLVFFDQASNKLVASQTTDVNSGSAHADTSTANDIETQQWINVVYIQNATSMKILVDGVEVVNNSFNPLEPALANDGSFRIGDVPGASGGSFVGYIDDVQIYNRELDAGEIAGILPQPPLGEVSFVAVSATEDEALPSPSTYEIALERTRGNSAELTVYVDFDAANSTATKGTLVDMDTPSNAADFAFVNEANYVSGKGIPITWAAGEKGTKSLVIKLDSADDGIREGTETARFILNDLNGADAGSNEYFDLRLSDLTPNPYGNFSVSVDELALKRVPETAGVQEVCFVRESGSTGDVTVNYQLSGNATAGTDYSNGDFAYVAGGIEPQGNAGSVTFTDGESANKCIRIQPFNNPAVGEADKLYTVEITGINHDSSIDPLLTEQNKASLVIYDYAPGEFAFSASTYDCKEPNSRENVPENKRAAPDETCRVEVTRSNTGSNAPAATLNVNAVDSYQGGISYSFNNQLTWPAIDANNPKNPATETQIIEFIIADNNSQDDDLVVDLSLVPNSGEAITSGAAQLTIEDVTEPAVVTINAGKATINEGETVVYTINRSGNTATEFDFNYGVTFTPEMVNAFDHYFDISGNNAKQNGVLSFTKGGINSQTLNFKSIDTPENNANFDMQVLLDNPSNNFVVGFGDLSQAGKAGKAGNKTSDSTTVQNTRDLIQSHYSVTFRDVGTGRKAADKTINHASTDSAPDYVAQNVIDIPTTRSIEVTLTIPQGLHIDSGASFTWKLQNADGTSATWSDGVAVQSNPNGLFEINRSGNLMYNAADVNKTADYSITTKLNLPFVSEDTAFKLVLDINGNTEIFSKAIDFTVKPLWRELQVNRNSKCLGVGSGTTGLRDCGSAGTWDDLQWAWNPANLTLLNKDVGTYGANRCMNLTGTTVSAATCVANDANQKINLVAEADTNNTRVQILVGESHRACANWASGLINIKYQVSRESLTAIIPCDADDRRWQWLN